MNSKAVEDACSEVLSQKKQRVDVVVCYLFVLSKVLSAVSVCLHYTLRYKKVDCLKIYIGDILRTFPLGHTDLDFLKQSIPYIFLKYEGVAVHKRDAVKFSKSLLDYHGNQLFFNVIMVILSVSSLRGNLIARLGLKTVLYFIFALKHILMLFL